MTNLETFVIGVAVGAAAVGAWWWWIGHRAKAKAIVAAAEGVAKKL